MLRDAQIVGSEMLLAVKLSRVAEKDDARPSPTYRVEVLADQLAQQPMLQYRMLGTRF